MSKEPTHEHQDRNNSQDVSLSNALPPRPSNNPFHELQPTPPDKIFSLNARFKEAERLYKEGKLATQPINLGVGKFVDHEGKTPPMESVSHAITRARRELELEKNGGYLPITGDARFCKGVEDLIVGHDFAEELRREGRLVSVQSLGGTGALNLAARLLKKGGASEIHVSDPTWANHHNVFQAAGLKSPTFPYLDKTTYSLDFPGLIAAHHSLPPGTIIKEDLCCHNPTGCDRTTEQWEESAELYKKRGLIALFDSAYAGFGTSLEEDLSGVRKFITKGIPTLVSVSFSKTASLYEERLGALLIILPPQESGGTSSIAEQATLIKGNLSTIIRTTYSNPPALHARAMAEILSKDYLRNDWNAERDQIATEIRLGRELLVDAFSKRGLPTGEIASQHGMFSFLPIADKLAERLEQDAQIYMVGKRINFAAVKSHNVETIAERIAELSKL